MRAVSRRKKREQYRDHDSGRWLKHHPPRYSDRYRHLCPEAVWREKVDTALRRWGGKQIKSGRLDYTAYRIGRHGMDAGEVASRIIGTRAERDLEAVRNAVLDLRQEADGPCKVLLVQRILRDHTHGIKGAAQAAGIAPATARRWVARFRRAVAWRLGYVEGDGHG